MWTTWCAGGLIVLTMHCERRPPPSPHAETREGRGDANARTTVGATRGVPAATATHAHPSEPRIDARGHCSLEVPVHTASGWTLRGFRPGPVFDDVVAIDHRRMVGVTGTRLCSTDDLGDHWSERLVAPDGADALHIERLDAHGHWLTIAAHGTGSDGAVVGLFASRDRAAEHWTPVTWPTALHTVRAAVADGVGRLFVADERQLFESDDEGGTWSPPRTLPGGEARDLDACGTTLIARARVDDDWFYHRSFDHGQTWRPFRAGAIGLEANRALLRCLSDRGGFEAGRAPLPAHWSWDGGHSWHPAGYDDQARAQARASTLEGAAPPAELPHCLAAPGRMIQCVDTGRTRLLRPDRNTAQEIVGPSNCAHVRQIDARRTVAFGDTCGFFVSLDRGGVWRPVSQAVGARPAGSYAEGRGGFVSDRIAWRLEGGVWWTFDRGESWQPFFAIGGRQLERGVFVDTRRGVFATNNGWVMATRDGGRTWTYVLHGDVERIASAPPTVIVTTTQTVRVSRDGGLTWLANGTPGPNESVAPGVEVIGDRRAISVDHGVRLSQRDDHVTLESDGAVESEVLRGLPSSFAMLAAHVARDHRPDRILFEGGAVLNRTGRD